MQTIWAEDINMHTISHSLYLCHPARSCLFLWVTIMHKLVFTRSSRYKGQKPHYAQITSGIEQALVSYTSQMNCLQSPSSTAQAFRTLITSLSIWAQSLNTSALWTTSVLMEERRRKKERWMNVNQHRERESVCNWAKLNCGVTN